jgi:hypothetical protein
LSNGASGRILATANLGQHREVREGRAAHVVVQLVAVEREARSTVRHHALALRPTDCGAEVGLARQARRTLSAFGGVERDHVIAGFDRRDAWPDLDYDTGAFVTEDRRKKSLGIGARQCEFIGVADAGCLDLDHHLAGLRSVELDIRHLERLPGRDGNRGFHVHRQSSTLRMIV